MDWYISKTMTINRPKFPQPPTELSEESNLKWFREVGEYYAQRGYGWEALNRLMRGHSPHMRKALRDGFNEGQGK